MTTLDPRIEAALLRLKRYHWDNRQPGMFENEHGAYWQVAAVLDALSALPAQPVAVSDEMVERVRDAVLSCGHTIVADEITLRRSEGKDGNALRQLSERIRAALVDRDRVKPNAGEERTT